MRSINTTEERIELQLQNKGLAGPRLTPDMIDTCIIDTLYWQPEGTTLTVCVHVLKNGFTVTGESACASVDQFDAAIGRTIACENARQKIWQLEGYLLREKLNQIAISQI